MQQNPPQGEARSDAELISSARLGDPSAFGELYARHAAAVTAMARYYARDNFSADDLVSEAFERTMTVLRGGGGPDVSFRAYIYTVVRRLAYEQSEKASKTQVTDDFTAFEMPEEIVDPAVSSFEGRVVTGAFATLPERWQAVLWYIEVEGMAPPEVAPLLGLTPNGVSALAYRAREGLRQAYLQLHVTTTAAKPSCEPFRGKLGAYSRNDLAARDTAKVEDHLSTCDDCTAIVAELRDVGHGMRVIIAPLVLGGVAATGLGFAGAPSSASAATVAALAPRSLGRFGKGVGAVASIAAAAALATVIAVTLSGGSPQSPEIVAAPSSSPAPAPAPSATKSPTIPAPKQTTEPAEPAPVIPPKRPTTPRPTPPVVVPPEVAPVISVTMDEVGNLVTGREGMVGATLTNSGTVDLTNPQIALALPSGVVMDATRPVSSRGGGTWTCVPSAGGVICTSPTLAIGQAAAVLVPVTVDAVADTMTAPSVVATAVGAQPVSATATSVVATHGLGTRFLIDGQYGVASSGASFLGCDTTLAGCTDAQIKVGDPVQWNNNSWAMYPLDQAVLGVPSSSTTLGSLGSGVVYAGLYWSGEVVSGDPAFEGAITLRAPNSVDTPITADRIDHATSGTGPTYQSYADVTSLVQAGGEGVWTASGAELTSGVVGAYAGWALVVVYEDASLAPGRVAIFDGFETVSSGPVTFGVAGIPGATSTVGLVGWEGDAGTVGDTFDLDGTLLSRDHGSAVDNVLDSTATGFGSNTFGVDVGSFNPTTLTHSAVTITASTTGDVFSIGVVTVVSR